MMRAKHAKKWHIRNTAKYFNISVSLVSENLFLFEHFKELNQYKSRNSALKKLK